MRKLWLALILVIAATADPAAARIIAAPGDGGAPKLTHGPFLTNGVVTWMTSECLSGCGLDDDEWEYRYRVHARHPPERAAVVAQGRIDRSDSGPNYHIQDISFSASDTHLALLRDDFGSDEFNGDYTGVVLRVGAFGQPLTDLVRCDTYEFGSERPALVSGRRLAYDAAPCDDIDALAVRDLDSGEEWQIAPGRPIGPFDLDGRHLAMAVWASAGWHVSVLDVETRATRYEFDLPQSPPPVAVDVAADGSLAVLTGPARRSCQRELSRYSPAGERDDRHAACELVAHLSDRTIFSVAGGLGRNVVEVRSGASAPRTFLELGTVPLRGADVHGNEFAWAVPECSGGDEIRLDALDTPGLQAEPPYCPGGLNTHRLLVGPRGRADVVLRCPMGCAGKLTLRVSGRTIAARRYAIPNGHTPVRVRVGRWARRRVAAGPLRARAVLTVGHLDGTHHRGSRFLRLRATR